VQVWVKESEKACESVSEGDCEEVKVWVKESEKVSASVGEGACVR
jgi:uncharacterized low-complexity protein